LVYAEAYKDRSWLEFLKKTDVSLEHIPF
jgi:hypothetical protein